MGSLAEQVHEHFTKDRRAMCLAGHFAHLVPQKAKVLDVGTGDGRIAALVLHARPDLSIDGVEFQVRDDCAIPVTAFDGEHLPFEDNSYDYVSFVDVLHHTEDPAVLLREAVRVARKGVILKDHLRQGFLAGSTLAFMDRVGNLRYGIQLPYNYLTPDEWQRVFQEVGLTDDETVRQLGLYPWWANWVFGRGLHFFARLHIAS